MAIYVPTEFFEQINNLLFLPQCAKVIITKKDNGSITDQEKDVSFLQDEMSLAAAQLVRLSRPQKRTRLFLDQ